MLPWALVVYPGGKALTLLCFLCCPVNHCPTALCLVRYLWLTRRVVELYGPESSGKTTLALHVIAEAQKAVRSAFPATTNLHQLPYSFPSSTGRNLRFHRCGTRA